MAEKWRSRKLWLTIVVGTIILGLYIIEYVNLWKSEAMTAIDAITHRINMIGLLARDLAIVIGGFQVVNVAQKALTSPPEKEDEVVAKSMPASVVDIPQSSKDFTGIEVRRTYLDNATTSDIIVRVDGHEVGSMKGLELPWKDNKKWVSCIPEGEYDAVKEESRKFGRSLIELKGVPNRSEVKFHAANHVIELEGCIAPGLSHIDFDQDGVIDITNSKKAETALMGLLPDECKVRIIKA